MSDVTGVIEKVKKHGNATNICVNGEWYGFGFGEFTFDEGDTVSFDTKRRGKYLNVVEDSMTRAEGKAAAKASSGSNYNTTQKSIQWQSARNAAIEVVNFAVLNNIASVGTTKAKKFDTYLALIDTVSERYFYDIDVLEQTGEAPTGGAPAVEDDMEEDDNDE